MKRRLCVGCGEVKPEDRFRLAHPDFPTRSGRVYKCEECAPEVPVYRLVPGAGPFRKIEEVEDDA